MRGVDQDQRESDTSVLAGGGEMGARMRAFDWSQTPIGPIEGWSQSLKIAVRIMLTSRQPIWLGWGEQLIKLYNDPYKAIVGGKHPAALGQPASVVWREIWDEIGPMLQTAMGGVEGTYVEAQLLIMERNGYPEETYYTFSYSPIPDDQGGVGGIICANTDDTERVIGERQLALLRELAARTADARTFDEACLLSARCLETNPHDLPFALIYLVDPERRCFVLAGTSGIARGHRAVPEKVAFDDDSVWPLAEVFNTHRPCEISDLRAIFDDLPTGAWQQPPHQAVAVPIASAGQTGKAGILVAGLNPFRLFDDRYRGYVNLIASQIAASIANVQAYEEERKRAESLAELDRAKTAFFSNISHEFRTPLTLMLGPMEDLLQKPTGALAPEDHSQLELMHRNGLRLLKLVNTLLDFSRIEAGRIQASYEPTDLPALTADLASVFRSTIERAGLRLIVSCPPLDQPVYIDRDMWEKVVLNLLSNAFKFTFEGQIEVAMRQAGELAELVVRDTGVGISPEEVPHLFERFHRVRGARGRTFEGSGIGLALVQELVRLHGGTVRVASELDRGTTFTISIPTGTAHLPADHIGAARTLASTSLRGEAYIEEARRWLPDSTTDHRPPTTVDQRPDSHLAGSRWSAAGGRVLLADDNADMREYVRRLLSQAYEVVAVSDGAAALRAAREQAFDLVLTDAMMPELDGVELLRALRADDRTHEVPVILLSARAGEEARVEGLRAGADDYLVKPFSANELLARVGAHLTMARVRRETARREQQLRAEAQAAREQLENVLAGISDQFVALDQDWRYVYVNDRVTDVTGRRREELLGRSIWALSPEIAGTEFERQLRRAVAEQTPAHFEYCYAPSNRWFEYRAYPSATGLTLFVADITARKQAEEALQASQERYRTLAEVVPSIIWTAAPDGTITYANDRWFDYCGITPEQNARHWPELVLHPEDQERCVQAWARALREGSEYEIEVRNRRHDGEYRWFITRAVPLRDFRGQITAWFGSTTDIHEQKQMEHALRESDARLRLAIEAGAIGIWDIDLRNGVRTWSEQGKAIYGLAAHEHMDYERQLALVHPEDRALVHGLVTAFRDQGTLGRLDFEHRVVRPDGSLCWVAVRGEALYEDGPLPVRLIGTVVDITARKRTEEALRESESRYRQLADAMPQLVWTSDSNGRVDYYNSRAAEYAGIVRADDGGWNWQPVLHPDDLEPTLAVWRDAARSGRLYTFEHRIRMNDGSFRWHLSRALPVSDADGRIVKWFGTATDIHVQKQAEHDSRFLADIGERIRLTADAGQLLEQVAQAVGEYLEVRRCMIIEIDVAHNRGVIRSEYCRGVQPVASEYMISDYSSIALAEISAGHTIVNNDSQIDPRTAAIYEATYRPYGERAYLAVPLMRDGTWNGTVWVSDDVPRQWQPREIALLETAAERVWLAVEKLRAEQALRANEERLQTLYAQEQAARAQAEAASRLKDEFLATVSHELRTPLTSILGYGQMIQTRRHDEAYVVRSVEKIVRGAKAQAQLIDDLLDVSRIVTGKLRIEPRPIDMVAVIQAAIEALRPAIDAKLIQLDADLHLKPGTIVGDPNRLQQVVWNLLSNAVKFTPSRGMVRMRLEAHGGYAQLTVSDTGQGISAEFLPYVFDRFRQAESASNRAHGGLGLGLSIVRHLVEMHGGTVQVQSAGVGLGATFTVRLPLVVDAADANRSAPEAQAVDELCQPALDGVRVLVVDDQRDIVELLHDMLVPCGAVVRTTTAAQEALAMLRAWRPNVLVSDIAMPGDDGYWLIRNVRALAPEQGGAIPAVALTAYVRVEDRMRVLAAGFQLYVPKPVASAELLDAVARLAGTYVADEP